MRLWTDFNAMSAENQCWILLSDPVAGQEVDHDTLREGARVVLTQDEGDFEVEATLRYGFVAALCKRVT
jgi:hypothetical protein